MGWWITVMREDGEKLMRWLIVGQWIAWLAGFLKFVILNAGKHL